MRQPKPRTVLMSLAAVIALSAAATTVVESMAFPDQADPKAQEAYDRGHAWVKARIDPEPEPAPTPTTAPNSPPPSGPVTDSLHLDRTVTADATPGSVIEFRAVRKGTGTGTAGYRELCDSYASTPEYTGSLSQQYRDDWVRGCLAAMTTPPSASGSRPGDR
ncbi:hypothetical protein [Streptomyces sp. NPDC059009]|uniref:hypothetical protein n=1 Tax=Streptomyces sp. NPDC059009 TaxID=3346694 RepID=UPI00369EA563